MVQVRVEERSAQEFVVALDGELDLATESLLTDAVHTLMAGGAVGHVVVDLAELRFLDSSGMRALLRAHQLAEQQGATLTVVRPKPHITEVLRIAALDHIIGIDAYEPGPAAGNSEPQVGPADSPPQFGGGSA